jgi:hypothetical protein
MYTLLKGPRNKIKTGNDESVYVAFITGANGWVKVCYIWPSLVCTVALTGNHEAVSSYRQSAGVKMSP